jgi:hypothetical protein
VVAAELEAAALLVAVVVDRVKVQAALVAIKPKARLLRAGIKPKVRGRIRPKVAAPLEEPQEEVGPQLPRGNPVNPAFPAMFPSSR